MEIKRGSEVEHKAFGKGVVHEVESHDDKDFMLEIVFEKHGKKVLHYATAKQHMIILGEKEMPYRKRKIDEIVEKTPTSKKKKKPK